tara:strand:- start:327 stop:1229 length:903 start_codon:yes stop_codon:yes gene_type:complete
MKDMYNMGGETADDKRYRMSMQKRNGYSDGDTVGLTEDQKKIAQQESDRQMQEAIDREDSKMLAELEKTSLPTFLNDALARKQMETELNNQDEMMRKNEGGEVEELDGKMEGGMMKYAEGSMLVPPEMGMEDEMPEDTYDNIPEDEKAAVEASQLPDSEMEEDYTGYVLGQSLDTEEQEYLMGILETDERLSGIFDKVMDVAGEFSGEGSVEGPGTGTSDSIPARLSDGEFVFTKKATDQMGADQLQTMMDEAEKAYDGGYMKKAFGGLTSEDDIEMDSYDSEEEVKKQMIAANQMPSIR